MRLVPLFLTTLLLIGCIGNNDTPGDSDPSTSPVMSASSGDTLIVMEEAKISSTPDRPEWVHNLKAGDTVKVVGKENIDGEVSIRVHHDNVRGWMGENYDFSKPKSYNSIQESGLDIMILSHFFNKTKSNEVNVHSQFSNISKSKYIRTISFTWELFGKNGNTVSTDKFEGSVVRGTDDGIYGNGVDPGESSFPGFELGYSPDVRCIELHEIKLEFFSSSSSTYSGESLHEITKLAENVQLVGECS